MTVESHTMIVELHLGTELQLGAELQTKADSHSNSEISVHERDVELTNREVHSYSKVDRPSEEGRAESRLSKYAKTHHPYEQIIRDKDAKPMTRNMLRSVTCILSMHKPKKMKGTLKNEDQSNTMREEIEQIKMNKTWNLVPRKKEKNVIGTK